MHPSYIQQHGGDADHVERRRMDADDQVTKQRVTTTAQHHNDFVQSSSKHAADISMLTKKSSESETTKMIHHNNTPTAADRLPGAFQEYNNGSGKQLSVVHKKQQIKRSVTFAKAVRFSAAPPRIIPYPEIPEDYSAEYWYTRADLEVFKNDRKIIVKVLKRNDFDLNVVERLGYILRGFECYFSMEINKAFKYTRCLVVSLVKTEQERQNSLGIHLPDLIRESSMCASEWARDNASHLGQKDFEEAYPGDRHLELRELEYIVRRQHARKRKQDQCNATATSLAQSMHNTRIVD